MSYSSWKVRSSRSRQRRRRGGFTLVELLVTVVLTLMLVFAIVSVFQWFGDGIVLARATLENSGQLRSAAFRFNQDIAGLTVPARPLSDPNSDHGYLEIIEGSMRDVDLLRSPPTVPGSNPPETDTTLGDIDDIIMFTARSGDRPFVGRFNGNLIQSHLAEIVWWAVWTDDGYRDPGEVTLHRRVLLIRPDLPASGVTDLATFHNANDVSVRIDSDTGRPVFNSLADLSIRANRFAHVSGTANFPNRIDTSQLVPQTGDHLGEDIILSDLLAFDIEVYDPFAPMQPGSNERGDFVNLNFDRNTRTSHPASLNIEQAGFSGPPRTLSKLNAMPLPGGSVSAGVYDTWTFDYERDGIDQDGVAGVDQAVNGLDDDGNNGVDDPGERETEPPYSVPLRGIKVTLRIIEFSTLQPRQTSIVTDFVPE